MSEWHDISTAPRKGLVLLLLGETIPDIADIRGGTFIDSQECEELGEFGMPNGGWMIWNSGDDWFLLPFDAPRGWAHVPSTPSKEPTP